MDIKKLINNNKWDEIYNLIVSKKLNPTEEITNGNTIAHLAAINNEHKLIEYLLKKHINSLEQSNDDGNTPVHLLALYGYTDLLKECIKENPNFLVLLNNDNENIPNILYNDIEVIKLIIKLHPDDIIINDNDQQNIVTKNINENNTEILELILKHFMKEINSFPDSFLCYAIQQNKDDIAKLLIKNGYDVNKKDHKFMTPFLYAVFNKKKDLIELLINHKADINYNGAEGDQNPLIWAINNQVYDLIELLMDNGFNVNSYNKHYETPLHLALMNKKISPTVLSKLLFYGDLNIRSVNGQTALHLLCRYHNWRNYNKIIKRKKLNIFALDKDNKRPIDYLSSMHLYDFIDTAIDSYVKIVKKDSNFDAKQCKKINSVTCKNEIKKYMFTTQRSIPKHKDTKILNQKIKLISGSKNAIHGLFNSDVLHNMIYTVVLMQKYKNIGIPFQYYNQDKFINDKLIQVNNNLFKTNVSSIIGDLVQIYTNFFYEFSPYLIVWRSSTEYYINKDLGFYLKKCLTSQKIRYIILKLTLVVRENNTHANIIIYDKKNKTLERFEPYGEIPYLDYDKLNDFIKDLGVKYFDKDLVFLSPKELFGSLGFQTISMDNIPDVKKLASPAGFCLAWTFWYLEMRVSNPNVKPNVLLSNAKDEIIKKYGKLNEKTFITFINDYSRDLDRYKNDFMKSAGININEIYNLVPSNKSQSKITNKLNYDFQQLVGEIY